MAIEHVSVWVACVCFSESGETSTYFFFNLLARTAARWIKFLKMTMKYSSCLTTRIRLPFFYLSFSFSSSFFPSFVSLSLSLIYSFFSLSIPRSPQSIHTHACTHADVGVHGLYKDFIPCEQLTKSTVHACTANGKIKNFTPKLFCHPIIPYTHLNAHNNWKKLSRRRIGWLFGLVLRWEKWFLKDVWSDLQNLNIG